MLYDLGAKKAVKESPNISAPATSPFALPGWMPYAVGVFGVIVVIGILLAAKGKD